MPQLLLATNNPGKVRELRALLAGCGWEITTPQDEGVELDAEEMGETYEANAGIKALLAARASGLTALADDSGIEVAGLDGAPGVHSARFLGEGATYPQRFTEINRRLEGQPPEARRARFVCVIAIALAGGEVRYVRGEVEGEIAREPRGERGFGYDPIFFLPDRGLTMAEIPEAEKGIISHRARAAAAARRLLGELLDEPGRTRPSGNDA